MPSTENPLLTGTEKKALRHDANYVGGLMLTMTVAMSTIYSLVVIVLALFGVLSSSQLTQDMLGFDSVNYLLFHGTLYTFAMGVPAVLVSLIAKKRYFPFSPCCSVNAADAFFGILSAMGICMLSNVVANVIVAFFVSHGVEEPQHPDYLEPNVTSLLLNLLVFAVLPALLEEMVFRGYVLRTLRRYGDWFAVAVSAFLFGLMHGNIAQVPFAWIVGVALGWLYIMTDNIWLPIAVHFANNAFSLLLEYYSFVMDDEAKGLFYAACIFMITTIGLISVGALMMRRSVLFRRLPRKSTLSSIRRLGILSISPLYLLCVITFIALLVWESV